MTIYRRYLLDTLVFSLDFIIKMAQCVFWYYLHLKDTNKHYTKCLLCLSVFLNSGVFFIVLDNRDIVFICCGFTMTAP